MTQSKAERKRQHVPEYDLRKITTKAVDASRQKVLYDGFGVGSLVHSTGRGDWPYGSRFVFDVTPAAGPAYWPVFERGGNSWRLPPETQRWQAFRRLVELHLCSDERREAILELCDQMYRLPDLRRQVNVADSAAAEEQARAQLDGHRKRVEELVRRVDSEFGGY